VRVTAIVVTWDSAADVAACLAALDAQDHPDLDIVVIDNASADDTVAVVTSHLAGPLRHPARLVRAPRNLGFCGAVNEGVRGSDAAAVLLVNPDAELAPDCLRHLVAVLAAHPECGTVQPRLLRRGPEGAATGPDARVDTTGHVLTRPRLVLNRGAGELAAMHLPAAGEVFGASGAVVLHRRAMLDDIARTRDGRTEWLTEDLVAYFDDVELDLRARMRGWTARHEPAAVGVHARAGATRRRSRRVAELNVANHLLVVVGHEPPRVLLRDAYIVVPVWVARLLAAVLRTPLALPGALWRLRLLPRALLRGRADRARATVPPAEVLARWTEAPPRGWLRAGLRRVLG